MLDKTRFPSEVGDAAPPCFGLDSEGTFYTSETQYGRPAVMILLGAEATSALPAILAELARCQPGFAARGADMFVIVDDNPRSIPNASILWAGGGMSERSDGSQRPTMTVATAREPIRTIDCGRFLARCGVGRGDTLVLILDRNLRIAMRADPAGHPALAAACLACLEALPAEAPRDIQTPAPAIILPNLLPPSMCRELIALFDSSQTIDGSVARVDAAGVTANVVDHAKKHRRDMLLEPDSQLHATLRDLLLDRCAPEIAKAFQARVAFTDRILVARYDGPGGLFRRHRDNTAGHVAFREFALSVNLNAGDYQGGHLLFPEYNDHRYATPTGGGVIFSASVMHEVAPVTAGSRYVLLTFLYGQQAEQRRLAQAAG
jgi:predicted 2-oxoglutarate/Fe(II)-dependent dioxygenase YbiX